MQVGQLYYGLDIQPGDIEKLQAQLHGLQNTASQAFGRTGQSATGAKIGLKELRNEVQSLRHEWSAGAITQQQFTSRMRALQGTALAQMRTLIATKGVAAKTTDEYRRLASVAGLATGSLTTLDHVGKKLTVGQQLLLGTTRALRFQLVRLGPIGYGTSVMMTTLAAGMTGARYGAEALTGKVARLQAVLLGLNGVVILSGVAALISLGVVAFRASKSIINLEQAQADVRKTTQFNSSEIQQLTEFFQHLSTEIGTTTKDLLDMAAVAGQLGIRGVANVAEFTETLAKLATVTNIAGRDGATQLARFLNITSVELHEMGEQAELSGNILNALENATASTASEILHMASQFAQVKAVVNISRPDILAYGATLRAVGVNAEFVGTNLTRIFERLSLAVSKGGDDLTLWAKAAQLTNRELSELVHNDPAEAMSRIAGGLRAAKDAGQDLNMAIRNLGIVNMREARIVRALVLGYDQLNIARREANKQVKIHNGEIQETSSLEAELEERLDTIGFQWKRFSSRLGVVVQVIGEYLQPSLRNMVDSLNDNAGAAATTGSSFITLIEVMKALGRAFIGLTQITVATVATIGSVLGEWSFQIEQFVGSFDSLTPAIRKGIEAQEMILNGDIVGGYRKLFEAIGEFKNFRFDGDLSVFNADNMNEALHSQTSTFVLGLENLTGAVQDYVDHIERIPEIQNRMRTRLVELNNEIDGRLLSAEVQGLLGDLQDLDDFDDKNKKRTAADVMADMRRLLAAAEEMKVIMDSRGLEFDLPAEKVKILNSALTELNTKFGHTVNNPNAKAILEMLGDLGEDAELAKKQFMELQEKLTEKYVNSLTLDVTFKQRKPQEVINQLQADITKLTEQASEALLSGDYSVAASIQERIGFLVQLLQSLLDEVATASEAINEARRRSMSNSAASSSDRKFDPGKRNVTENLSGLRDDVDGMLEDGFDPNKFSRIKQGLQEIADSGFSYAAGEANRLLVVLDALHVGYMNIVRAASMSESAIRGSDRQFEKLADNTTDALVGIRETLHGQTVSEPLFAEEGKQLRKLMNHSIPRVREEAEALLGILLSLRDAQERKPDSGSDSGLSGSDSQFFAIPRDRDLEKLTDMQELHDKIRQSLKTGEPVQEAHIRRLEEVARGTGYWAQVTRDLLDQIDLHTNKLSQLEYQESRVAAARLSGAGTADILINAIKQYNDVANRDITAGEKRIAQFKEWQRLFPTIAKALQPLIDGLKEIETKDKTVTLVDALIGKLGSAGGQGKVFADNLRDLAEAAGFDVVQEPLDALKDQLNELSEIEGIDPALIDAIKKIIAFLEMVEGGGTTLNKLATGLRTTASEMDGLARSVVDASADIVNGLQLIIDEGKELEGITAILQGLNTAIKDISEAATDEGGFDGNDVFDLYAGLSVAAAEIVGLLTGIPGLGQLAAASMSLIKVVLGDMANGAAEVNREIKDMAENATFITEASVKALTQTHQVSRGGLLGLFGLTKEEILEEATEFGIELAESIGGGLAGAIKNSQNMEDFRKNFLETLNDIILDTIIEVAILEGVLQEKIVDLVDTIREALEDGILTEEEIRTIQGKRDRLRNEAELVYNEIRKLPFFNEDDVDDPTGPDRDDEPEGIISIPNVPTPLLAAPVWVSEMGMHVTKFGEHISMLANPTWVPEFIGSVERFDRATIRLDKTVSKLSSSDLVATQLRRSN